MAKSEIKQDQKNEINIAYQEHGITDFIPCRVKNDLAPSPVKVLIFQGNVKRVFCELFENGSCSSPNTKNSKCYLYQN